MYLSGFIRLDIEEFTEPCVPRKITRLLVVDFSTDWGLANYF